MHKIFIVISICVLSFPGCATYRRNIESARESIEQLEQLNTEEAARIKSLESLVESERAGNQELERIIGEQKSKLNGYIESERIRSEDEKRIIESLSGIFIQETDIIEQLKKGYQLIREYFEAERVLE